MLVADSCLPCRDFALHAPSPLPCLDANVRRRLLVLRGRSGSPRPGRQALRLPRSCASRPRWRSSPLLWQSWFTWCGRVCGESKVVRFPLGFRLGTGFTPKGDGGGGGGAIFKLIAGGGTVVSSLVRTALPPFVSPTAIARVPPVANETRTSTGRR